MWLPGNFQPRLREKKIGTKNTKTASNCAVGWWFFWIEDGISVNFLLVTFWKGSKKLQLHASKFLWYDWYRHFLPPYLSKDNHAMLTGARELPIRPISLSIHMFCAYRYAHTERRIRKYIYIFIYTRHFNLLGYMYVFAYVRMIPYAYSDSSWK